MKILILISALFISGCASNSWTCIADVNRDNRCKVVPCESVPEICKAGNYRVLKSFPDKQAFVYSTKPLTDLDVCRKEAIK
jgi:hypothetical protein